MEDIYGKLLHQESNTRSIFRANLYFIPTIIIAACGVATIFILEHIPDQYDPIEYMLPYIIFGIAIALPIYATIIWRLRTPLEGRIFERGIKINKGKKIIVDIAFSDIKGIVNYVETVYGIKGNRIIVIVAKNGERTRIPHSGLYTRKFKKFLDTLIYEYTTYLINDLTLENIDHTDIKFSTNLKLSGGKLIHTAKGKEVNIHDVSGVQVRRGHIRIKANVDGKEKVWLRSEPIEEVINLCALIYIVDTIILRKQTWGPEVFSSFYRKK